MLLIHTMLAALLALLQTPAASPEASDANVYLDLGAEHCASEIAFASYEYIADDEIATAANPDFMTYTAYQFASADDAEAALDDAPLLAAETFGSDPNIAERDNLEDLLVEVESMEYGDVNRSWVLTLPAEDSDALDVLTIEMIGVVKQDQLLLVMMFSETGTNRPGAGLSISEVPPFTQDFDDRWDGTDLQSAVPAQEEMPPRWDGGEVTLDTPPGC